MGNKKGKVNINIDNVIEKLSILTDDQEVHHSLTRSFEESFGRQAQYTEGFMKENIDIEWLMQKENFMNVYANKGIETEDIETVYEAIVKPTDDMDKHKAASEEMRDMLEQCPTLNEVKEAIKYSKKGKAGGPAGLT